MELDDLKTAWQSLDQRLERQQALNLQLFRDSRMSRLQASLAPLRSGQGVQIAAGALLMLLFAPFWVEHRDVVHLLVYGLSLHAYGLMMVIFAARALFLIHQIDRSAPVLALQKQLAELRDWQVTCGVWFALVGCFIWTPLMLTLFYWLGVDVWLQSPAVVGWFVFSSFVAFGISCALIQIGRRPQHSRLGRYLHDNAMGNSLRAAQATLDELARFEAG